MVKTGFSDELLPPEHADALRRVDLHLYFGRQGDREPIPGYGYGVLGITDHEYERSARMTADLNPERGDILAITNPGFCHEWSPVDAVKGLERVARQSLWITREFNVIRSKPGEPLSTPILSKFLRINLAELLALAQATRRFRVAQPAEYAGAHAIEKGLQCLYADADAQDLDEWEEYKQEEQRRAERISKSAVFDLLGEGERRYRARRMVARLGIAAATMHGNDRNDPPRLAYTADIAYRHDVTRILRTNKVRFFTRHSTTPHLTRSQIADTTRWTVSFLPFIASPEDKRVKGWLANAHAQDALYEGTWR